MDKLLQAAIVIMVILTTSVAPPLLCFTFKDEETATAQTDLATNS